MTTRCDLSRRPTEPSFSYLQPHITHRLGRDRRSAEPRRRSPRSRRPTDVLGSLALALVLTLPSVAQGEGPGQSALAIDAAPRVPIVPVEEIERGQRGYGLSVFAGHEPERFEFEVLGVLHHSTPELSYIMARLSGQDLERSGVAGGMSGSPVYLDDRLVGAVAFSYLFGLDAIAGITPIQAMRRLSELPAASPIPGLPVSSGGLGSDLRSWAPSFEQLARGERIEGLLDRHLTQLTGGGGGTPSGMGPAWTWTAAGFGDPVRSLLEGHVGTLRPVLAGLGAGAVAGAALGSSTQGALAQDLVGGSAVSAVLVDGDLHLAAHGTVTERQGDEILAFGHPMFGLGPIQVPLATSEVVTVIASTANSFKVSNAGTVIGIFDQDREAGVRGRLGVEPPQTPLEIRLKGAAERTYLMRVAEIQAMRPLLMTVATLGALDAGSRLGGYQGIDMEARFALAGHDDVWIRQSFDGDSAGTDAALHLLSLAAFLEFNSWQALDYEAVEVELHQVEHPRSASLVAGHPERLVVAPGERVGVHLELDPYRGERRRERVEVEIPSDAPEGRYYVFLGGGTSLDAVRLAVEKTSPESFDQALDALRGLHSRRDLVTYGVVARPGMVLQGQALPALPGSVRSLVTASRKTDLVPLSLQIVHRRVQPFDVPIDGAVRIDFEIERPRD